MVSLLCLLKLEVREMLELLDVFSPLELIFSDASFHVFTLEKLNK